MFFCFDLVFGAESTRVIQKESYDIQEVAANVHTGDYVLSNVIIDPLTKNNVETYILKDNADISFLVSNYGAEDKGIVAYNYYYTTCKSKNIKIRLLDKAYESGMKVRVIPDNTYAILKATNRLKNALFIYTLHYATDYNGEYQEKEKSFYFKFVTDKEYDMYKDMSQNKEVMKEIIVRPKAQN